MAVAGGGSVTSQEGSDQDRRDLGQMQIAEGFWDVCNKRLHYPEKLHVNFDSHSLQSVNHL